MKSVPSSTASFALAMVIFAACGEDKANNATIPATTDASATPTEEPPAATDAASAPADAAPLVSLPQPTDYSQAAYWLSLPATQTNVDVFYLYPTEYQKSDSSAPDIGPIDDPGMSAGANAAFERQATVFAPMASVFAPYYRQADARVALTLPPDQRHALLMGAPTLDATAAFDYYIRHYNAGRPYILASHSQGSDVMLNLLAGYLRDNPDVYARMIAAYTIGCSVTNAYLADNPHLKFATGPDDTGVIVSYNTQSADVPYGGNPVVMTGALAINPINWKRDETLATAAEGLGSLMPVNGVLTQVSQYADARVDLAKGVLITTADGTGLPGLLAPGIFHGYDYPFYYLNLRANAANRTARFLADNAQGPWTP